MKNKKTANDNVSIIIRKLPFLTKKQIKVILSLIAFLTNQNGFKESITISKVDKSETYDIDTVEKNMI